MKAQFISENINFERGNPRATLGIDVYDKIKDWSIDAIKGPNGIFKDPGTVEAFEEAFGLPATDIYLLSNDWYSRQDPVIQKINNTLGKYNQIGRVREIKKIPENLRSVQGGTAELYPPSDYFYFFDTPFGEIMKTRDNQWMNNWGSGDTAIKLGLHNAEYEDN